MWWIGLHRLPPELYYRYRLFLPERRRRAIAYLGWTEHNEMLVAAQQHGANGLHEVMEDKAAFERWCRDRGLAVVTSVAAFAEGRRVDAGRALPLTDLVVKPTREGGGRGVTVHPLVDDGWLDADSDGRLDVDGLVTRLARRSLDAPIVVQRRLRNHPLLSAFSPKGALCTVRVVTARGPDGRCGVLFAGLGMPTGDGDVDNFHAGGLCAPIDPVTGRLGTAARVYESECMVRHDRHPDTGARIRGVILPAWDQVRRLALRAHALAEHTPFVGWDIVVDPDGPRILEANPTFDAALSQVTTGTPLGESVYLPYLLHHMGHTGSESGEPLSGARR